MTEGTEAPELDPDDEAATTIRTHPRFRPGSPAGTAPPDRRPELAPAGPEVGFSPADIVERAAAADSPVTRAEARPSALDSSPVVEAYLDVPDLDGALPPDDDTLHDPDLLGSHPDLALEAADATGILARGVPDPEDTDAAEDTGLLAHRLRPLEDAEASDATGILPRRLPGPEAAEDDTGRLARPRSGTPRLGDADAESSDLVTLPQRGEPTSGAPQQAAGRGVAEPGAEPQIGRAHV